MQYTLGLEIPMARIILSGALATVLLAGGSLSAHENDWARARFACADVGIDPNSTAFSQCVLDLYYSVWDEENVSQR
jgi:hypothetical protein